MEDKHSLKRNQEFSFLYKNTSIRGMVISKMTFVPEYMDALRAYKGTLDDNAVYEVIRATYLKMLENGTAYKTAKDVLRKVSKDVKGDSLAWETE